MEYVRVVVEIDHPVDRVWAMIAGFGAIKAWIEGIEACALEGDGGVGSIRSVTRGGSVTRERLEALDPAAHSLTYSLVPPYRLQAKDVRATIELTAPEDGRTIMTWYSQASEFDEPMEQIAAYIDAFYRASIGNLVALLDKGAPA